ncbi:MAG TPA: 2OG-Fe(II) oxygenase [Candidatus Binatia bacterium]|nr:2OG-Fe(II) oxygenase [Candidatus Binatia bacterium]
MARYRFGVGEYKYFAAPLPAAVAALRTHVYRRLAPIANRWMTALGAADRYPPDLAAYLARCAAAGQERPTPLLLHYRAGGYNCLHQDLYGALAFPLQLTCVLSQVGEDFRGGELLLVEQRPRAQSRGDAIVLQRGEAVIFPTRHRPVRGVRGVYRATVRHGVSRLHAGERTSLGIIFHDAA